MAGVSATLITVAPTGAEHLKADVPQLPTTLDGVSVTMGGKPAYVYFISSGQLNVLAPDLGSGPVPVTVTTPAGTTDQTTPTTGPAVSTTA